MIIIIINIETAWDLCAAGNSNEKQCEADEQLEWFLVASKCRELVNKAGDDALQPNKLHDVIQTTQHLY